MTKEELYTFILENRQAYHRMLKSTDLPLYKEVQTKYSGVKNIGESFWLYCHNYNDTLKCKCGTKLAFENVVSGYNSKECLQCHRNRRKLNSSLELKY